MPRVTGSGLFNVLSVGSCCVLVAAWQHARSGWYADGSNGRTHRTVSEKNSLPAPAGSIGTGTRRGLPLVGLVVGLTGMFLGGLHLANATGPIGSGSGRLGAIVALAVGLIGAVLGGLALSRSRRTLETR